MKCLINQWRISTQGPFNGVNNNFLVEGVREIWIMIVTQEYLKYIMMQDGKHSCLQQQKKGTREDCKQVPDASWQHCLRRSDMLWTAITWEGAASDVHLGSLWVDFFLCGKKEEVGVREGWTGWAVTQRRICSIEWFKGVGDRWQPWKVMSGLDSQAVNGGLRPAALWHCPHFGMWKSDSVLREARDGSLGLDKVIVQESLAMYQIGMEKRDVNIVWNSHVVSNQAMKTSHFCLQFPNTSSLFFLDLCLLEEILCALELRWIQKKKWSANASLKLRSRGFGFTDSVFSLGTRSVQGQVKTNRWDLRVQGQKSKTNPGGTVLLFNLLPCLLGKHALSLLKWYCFAPALESSRR